jgi:hypothetical protein
MTGMRGGDSALLCKGGVWILSTRLPTNRWNNQNCTVGNFFPQVIKLVHFYSDAPCAVADYTPTWGGAAKPRVTITGSVQMYSLEFSNTCTQTHQIQIGFLLKMGQDKCNSMATYSEICTLNALAFVTGRSSYLRKSDT